MTDNNVKPYISLRNVSFSYELEDGMRLGALKNISLDIKKGVRRHPRP